MLLTILRKVDGSVMFAVPPAILDLLHLRAGSTVGVSVDDGKLVIAPVDTRRYRLAELLAQCDPTTETPDDARAWLDDGPQGGELL
jgi:antitoxin ChpS